MYLHPVDDVVGAKNVPAFVGLQFLLLGGPVGLTGAGQADHEENLAVLATGRGLH